MRSFFAAFLRLPIVLALLCFFSPFGAHGQISGFAQPTVIPTGSWPVAVYTADMDGDGLPDLIYVDPSPGSGSAHIRFNQGAGVFSSPSDFGIFGTGLAIGDYFGDGKPEVSSLFATANAASNGLPCAYSIVIDTSIFRGTRTLAGTVQSSVCAAGTQMPVTGNLVAARLQDGKPANLLFTDSANQLLYVLDLHGNGSSTTGVSISSVTALPDGVGPIQTADLNADGHLDVVIQSPNPAIATSFLGNGDGTLKPGSRFTGSSGIHSLLLADVNQDGRLDMIAEGVNGRIDVFPGNGDGTFASASIGGPGTLDGLSGNGGHLIGLAQLAATQQPVAFTSTPAGISSLLGQGNAYFGLKGIYNAGPGRTSYALADLNQDGNLDLAVDSPEGIAILYGNPDGSFQTSQAFAAGQPALDAGLGVFTASGHVDAVLATAASQAQLLLGQGDGTFVAAPAPTNPQTGPAGLWSRVQTGDFNGDGKRDLALTADGANAALPATGTGLSVQLGNGDGTFGPATAINVANQFAMPAPSSCQPPFDHFPGLLYGTSVAGDFNEDGLMDVANRDSGAYRILRGNNGTTSSSSSQYPTLFWSGPDGTSPTSDCNLNAHNLVVAGDLNHDGIPDLIFQNNGSLLVYLTGAGGALAPAGDLAVDGSLTTAGQLTAPDIAANFGGMSSALGYPAFPGSAVLADLDGDGNQDLLVLYANLAEDPAHPGPQAANVRNWLYVWYGSGGGKFLTSAAHPQNPVRIQPSRDFYQMAVGKVDSSAQPLIVMSDGYMLSIGTFGAEVHLLAGQGINSIAIGDLRGTGQQDIVVANGGLTLSNPVANHETLTPNPDGNTGGVTVLLNSNAVLAPAGTVTASPEPSYAGVGFTLTAALTGNATTPGSFTFSVDGNPIGTVQGNGSTSIAGPSTLGLGSHTLEVLFRATASALATQFSGTHTVLLSPTTTVLTPTTPLTVYYGQPIDGTFAVSNQTGAPAPTGNYSLEDNGVDVTSCTAIPLNQACPYGNPELVDAGPHVFTVHYLGDAGNAPSFSAPISYTVLPDLTAVSLTSSLNPATQGSSVLFSTAVTGNVVNPINGTVTFLDGATVIGTGSLDSAGRSGFSTSTLSVGDHTITVAYAGARDFNPATSPALVEHIVIASTSVASAISLTSSLNPAAPGQLVALTASVTVPGPFAYVPTGTVTFTVDGQASGAAIATDAYGIARMNLPTLAPGTHSIIANYSGNSMATRNVPAILPSVSNTLLEIITTPLQAAPDGFLLTVSPTTASVTTGRLVFFVVTVTPQSGFNQPVALTCSGLPTEAACMFLPALVPPGGGSVPMQVSTAAPHDCGDPGHPYYLSRGNGPLRGSLPFAASAVLFGLIWWRRRPGAGIHLLRSLALLSLLGGTLWAMSGCGHCTDLGTRPGTYTFTVTGTAQGGPVSETASQRITLTVELQ